MTPSIFGASEFAVIKHDGQKRGGGKPYVHHCFDVARRLSFVTDNESVLTAAILHDVLEDTDATVGQLDLLFGSRVAQLVVQLTLPADIQKDVAAKRAYQIDMMKEMDAHGRFIKIADKTSNVFDLVADPPKWGRRALLGYAQEAKAVVDSVRDVTGHPDTVIGMRLLIRGFDEAYAAVLAKHG